jgi:hypothetical protein
MDSHNTEDLPMLRKFVFDEDQTLLSLRIYRTDGSGRTYEAVRTHSGKNGIIVWVSAVFSVGEVVELASDAAERDEGRERARVMYRNNDQYGLLLLGRRIAMFERKSA